MKKSNFVLIFLILVAISLTLPLKFSSDFETYLDYFIKILGALSAAYALVIAILLYDRFSVERDVLSKQLEAVTTLAQNIYFEEFYIEIFDGQTNKYCIMSKLYRYGNEACPDEYKDFPLRLTIGVYERLRSITSGVQLIYLPDTIYENVKNLFGYSGKKVSVSHKFAFVRKINDIKQGEKKGVSQIMNELYPEQYYEFNQTLGQFCKDIFDLYNSISEWLNKHGYENARTNMDFIVNSINAEFIDMGSTFSSKSRHILEGPIDEPVSVRFMTKKK